MKRALPFAAKAMATCGFLTYLPARWRTGSSRTGAGLIGTVAGLGTFLLLPHAPSALLCVLASGLLLSVVISDYVEELLGTVDDPRIVIDEWIGYWFAAAFLPSRWEALAAAFILFRVFDSLKPGPIARLAHLPGGWGVVLDDVAAGVLANLVVQVIGYIHPL